MRSPDKFWNPYLAGIALGLVVLSAYVLMGRGIGASGASYRTGVAVMNAIALQDVKKQEVKVQEVETQARIAVATMEAERKQKELVATQVRPAEAQKEAVLIEAEGQANAAVAKAEGEAKAAKLRAGWSADTAIDLLS